MKKLKHHPQNSLKLSCLTAVYTVSRNSFHNQSPRGQVMNSPKSPPPPLPPLLPRVDSHNVDKPFVPKGTQIKVRLVARKIRSKHDYNYLDL